MESGVANPNPNSPRLGFAGSFVRVASLVCADLLCICSVWVAVVYGYKMLGFGLYMPENYLVFWPVAVVFVLFNVIFRLYHGNCFYPSMPLGEVEEFRRLVVSAVITHLLAMAYLGFSRQVEIVSRVVLIVSGVGVAFLSQPVRNVFRVVLWRLGVGRLRAFLVGSGPLAQQIADSCAASPFLGYRIVGSFDHRGEELKGVPRLGSLRDIVRLGHELKVKRLVVCEDERLLAEQIMDFTKHFQFIDFIPPRKAFPVFESRLIELDGLCGIEMVNQSCMRLLRAEKTVLDFMIAVAAMVVFLPLFVVIPLLIKLTSRGPVFYRHHRLGKDGRPIRVWKFRSMYVDADERLKEILARDPKRRAEWEANFKLVDDPRITPVGNFLRKTSLDELPQLFNVFAGDMSVVGPRPIVEDEVHYYGDRYALFSRVKPGITGLWQASGRSDTNYDRRVALDCHYVLNWSPWMDVWVIIRTAIAVLAMKGAR